MSRPERPKQQPTDQDQQCHYSPWRRDLPHAFIDAGHGLTHSLRAQRNLRLDWCGAFLVLGWCLVCRPTGLWVTVAVISSALVMAAELFNTALEYSIDLAIGHNYNELARLAKDASAGGVLLTSIGAASLGTAMLVLNWPWHWRLLSDIHLLGAVESACALAALFAWAIRTRWLVRHQGKRDGFERRNED